MAIKGKSRAKSRPKQVGRAPRREPVVVKPPLFRRRWLQLTATFILGVFAMSIAVWVWHGVSSDNAQKTAANVASAKRAAAQGWQTTVEGAFSTLGTTPQPGSPPTMFPDMAAALTAMEKGPVPKGAAATFAKASKSAATASTALTKYGVADKIRNQGFNAEEATAFTDSLSGLVGALDQYAKAAQAGSLALQATGARQHALVTFAQSLQASATSQLSDAWSNYEGALVAGGITESPLTSGATGTTPIGG
jgi:soluble cytochrome b562